MVKEAQGAGLGVDFAGKVIPGGFAFVGEVVDARLWRFSHEDGGNRAGKVVGPGGGSPLVGYDAQVGAVSHEPQHSVDEVGAVPAIEPGGSDDDGLGAGGDDAPLPFFLGLAIDTGRTRGIILAVGPGCLAVEDIIGRNMEKASAKTLCKAGDMFRSHRVEREGKLRLVLSLVDRGVSSAVHDGADAPSLTLHLLGKACKRLWIEDGDLAVCTDMLNALRRQKSGKLLPEHALVADNPDHSLTSRKVGSAASFADTMGAIPISGQAIAMSGSFQRSPPSLAALYSAVHLY